MDLIFPDEPHDLEPPWRPSRDNLHAIDAHFWDWILWLSSKEAGGKPQLVADELEKLFEHLLAPLGVKGRPSSIREAITSYRGARDRAERQLGVLVSRKLETAVASAVDIADPS